MRHKIFLPEGFIEFDKKGVKGEYGGFSWILEDIPARLKRPDLYQTIGVVIDADENAINRWDSIRGILLNAGYPDLPRQPDPNGSIFYLPRLPRVGVWIMPDNQLRGMLEDFVKALIPNGDSLGPLIESHLNQIEAQGFNRYQNPLHHSKAFIHSWLACQESPGHPMGLAITCRYLNHDEPIALSFINWLRTLYNL
jgi:hypothetical protein